MFISWIKKYEKLNEKDTKFSLLFNTVVYSICATLSIAMVLFVLHIGYLTYHHPAWGFVDFSTPNSWWLFFTYNYKLSLVAFISTLSFVGFVYIAKCDFRKLKLKSIELTKTTV